jgi:hypothetical protein
MRIKSPRIGHSSHSAIILDFSSSSANEGRVGLLLDQRRSLHFKHEGHLCWVLTSALCSCLVSMSSLNGYHKAVEGDACSYLLGCDRCGRETAYVAWELVGLHCHC